MLSLSANRIHKWKRINYFWLSSWLTKMAEICGSGFSQQLLVYLKHNAEETASLAEKKNLWVPSKQLWEHNISQCVAFCFVSTKAAVHRKSLDSLWIAALPTESGTCSAWREERRGELLAAKHYVPQVFVHNNRPAELTTPHPYVFVWLKKIFAELTNRSTSRLCDTLSACLLKRNDLYLMVKQLQCMVRIKKIFSRFSNWIISFWSTRTELTSGTLLFLELHCNVTLSPQDGNLDATTFGVLLDGALGVSLSALKRRKDDDRASKATYPTNQVANASP